MSTDPTCKEFVSRWGGEYEGYCQLPEGHASDHFDGLSYFDDDNECRDDWYGEDGQRFTPEELVTAVLSGCGLLTGGWSTPGSPKRGVSASVSDSIVRELRRARYLLEDKS